MKYFDKKRGKLFVKHSLALTDLPPLSFKCNMPEDSEEMTENFSTSDMWGVGVIAYLLVSGGVSPFWGGNR